MNKDASKIGIWGGTGSGKSTRARELVEHSERLIIFDPIQEYRHSKKVHPVYSLRELWLYVKKNWARGFRVAYVLSAGMNPPDELEALAYGILVMQEPYHRGKEKRQVTLMVEEMALSYPEKTSSADDVNFKYLVNVGRHYGVNIIGISQRIAEVKKNFVGNCAEHYFFRMGAATDAQTAAKFIGGKSKDALMVLKPHHYLHFKNGECKGGVNRCNF